MNRLLIVDGSNLLFQMFFGMPSRITNSEGKAIQGTLGFVGALLKIIRRAEPTHIAVLFDGEHKNERTELNADYKANRVDYSQTPEEDSPFSQLPDVYAALDYMGIKHTETTVCETDDWIAGYAHTYGDNTEATLRNDGDVRNYITFFDGDEFLPNWGFGEDNCGNETNLAVKGDIQRTGTVVTSANKVFLLDIVGRYTVTIGGKSYDTVCVMDIETYDCGVVSEQFLDKNGKTILWRRFNRDDWAIDRYKKPWSEQLPENDRLTVNGTTYVHWYDCITDYIL